MNKRLGVGVGGGTGGPRAGLDIVENTEVSYPAGNSTAIPWFCGL